MKQMNDLLKTPHAMDFVNLSISILEQNHSKYEPTARWLSAYVFYLHRLEHIEWKNTCSCPDPKRAIQTLTRKRYQIDDTYSKITSDHLAWAAKRSFYIDFFCCCINYKEGCENLWKFWLQGIVSQIAIANMHFSKNNKCNTVSLPKKAPNSILGLWHFSFTQDYVEAKKYLLLALQENKTMSCGCPIRDIAIIMALHQIHTSQREEYLTTEIIHKHLTSGSLIDYHLPNHIKSFTNK